MLRDRLDVSERWACRVVGQHRSTERYEPKRAVDDAALRARLRKVSVDRPRWGYRRAHAMLVEDGWEVNRKRVQRIWREEGLRVPQRKRKRRRLGESTVPASRLAAERPNHVWALDYQHDQTADGRTIRLLNWLTSSPAKRSRCWSSAASMQTRPWRCWSAWSPSVAGRGC
jgi:putative transposase